MSTSLTIWENKEYIQEIKQIFAPTLSPHEFQAFIELGKFTNLNPFLKEIWAVKFGSSAAQIFIGRDGYRKSAQRHPQYDYHYAEAVYSNDFFESNEGIYHHKFNLKDRGVLAGAYCNVKRKDSSRPISLYVDFREYNLNQSLWKTKPATMIKKVAEAQCIRMAFQELFSGTYDESEDFIPTSPSFRALESKHSNKVSAQLPSAPDVPTNSTVVNFGDSAEDKKTIFKLASEMALAFNLDPQKDAAMVQDACRAVVNKNITEETLEIELSKSFYEIIKSKEVPL